MTSAKLKEWRKYLKLSQAAAAADFVVAFYNPVSQRRRDQLARARDILLTGRPATEMKSRNGNRIITKIKHKDFL